MKRLILKLDAQPLLSKLAGFKIDLEEAKSDDAEGCFDLLRDHERLVRVSEELTIASNYMPPFCVVSIRNADAASCYPPLKLIQSKGVEALSPNAAQLIRKLLPA
jgi:hypothetical protein